MSKLYQAATGIGDFRQATISFWFRMPTTTAAVSGFPADKYAARSVFGNPHLLFIRDNTANLQFYNNQGKGGTFARTGVTPTDFSPGPGQ